MSFNKKKEINFKKDLFGRECDYSHYSLKGNEKIIGFLLGFGTAFVSIYIFFQSIIASLIVGIVLGFLFLPFYQSFLLKKQREKLLLQFTDLLDSLSNSYSAGKNTMGAFRDSLNDLIHQHGNQAMIVVEVNIIVLGLENNFTIEELLLNYSDRCNLDDVKSFVDTFIICNRSGGNLKSVVMESRNILSDKIEIGMEIETAIIEKKNELNIMLFMPLIVVAMLGTLGSETITNNTPINLVIKIIAIFIFILAYLVGKKITNIKI
ncbi:MAG: kinase [Bacillales bacterium]|jgi:tight adherence protein B|nr:kinase [Bacillales bacterium]